MSKAKITLLGFYNYDNTLFNNIQLPDGINKDRLVNNILLECGEFEVLYANYNFYKNAIEHFFLLNFDLFKRWIDALNLQYNPLENYDRIEHWQDDFDGKTNTSGNVNNQGSTTDTASGSNTDTSSGSTTQNNNVSSFDSNDLVSDTQSTGSATNNASSQSSSNASSQSTNSETSSGQELKDDVSVHDGRVHGNIGVTTSQQMLESELELRQKWQIIKIITEMFMRELVIAVYD